MTRDEFRAEVRRLIQRTYYLEVLSFAAFAIITLFAASLAWLGAWGGAVVEAGCAGFQLYLFLGEEKRRRDIEEQFKDYL